MAEASLPEDDLRAALARGRAAFPALALDAAAFARRLTDAVGDAGPAALGWLGENRAETRARDAAAAEPLATGNTHPEMAFLKERYRGDFEQALREALG